MTGPVGIRVERVFRHPRERVFDAFLDPARAGQWLFRTPGGVLERADLDPRPGGEFTIVEKRGDALAHHFGRFIEIARPDRIVFDFWVDEAPDDRTRVTVEFEAAGDGCRLVLTHVLAPEWADYAERTTAGWTLILDNLHRLTEV